MIEEHEQEYSEQYEDGFKTVLKFFSAENEKQCERNLYKYTSCGAWIEFKDWGIRLGSIVEGSDEGTDVFELKYDEDFSEETIQKAIDQTMKIVCLQSVKRPTPPCAHTCTKTS